MVSFKFELTILINKLSKLNMFWSNNFSKYVLAVLSFSTNWVDHEAFGWKTFWDTAKNKEYLHFHVSIIFTFIILYQVLRYTDFLLSALFFWINVRLSSSRFQSTSMAWIKKKYWQIKSSKSFIMKAGGAHYAMWFESIKLILI